MHDSGRVASQTAQAFAWLGAGVFVLSLSYFLYSYWTAFGTTAAGPRHAGDVVWNVVLFSAFALHHSLFAREPFRRRVIHAFPHLERSLYVWVASLLFILVCWLWRPVPGVVWELDGAARVAVVLLHIGGIILSVYSASVIDAFDLAGVRQLDSRRAAAAQRIEFKTKGPYGLVRHPIYLGWFLLVFAAPTMTMTRLVFAIVSCAYVLAAIPFEERSLRASTGDTYDRYMQQVPRKLIPWLY